MAQKELSIAMFGHKRIPSREGGIEVVVEELSTRMAERGCRVVVYNRGGHNVAGKEFDSRKAREYGGVRIRSVPTLEGKGLAALTASFFGALCSSLGKYDVVHIHAEGPAFFCLFPHVSGKRVVVTVHGLDWQRAKWQGGPGAGFIRAGERMAARYADEIIVLSREAQRYFMREYGRETRFIPNGIGRCRKRPPVEIAQKWGLGKDGYVLYLGRVVPEKGAHYLVEAFRGLVTDKKLVIAGGASDTDGYYEGLRTQAGEGVVFTGFVQGTLLEELYSNAYVYVLPSDLEGMPLSLLEAMGYGNCCLTSDIPECAEVVEDKAATFRKGDVGDLGAKLGELLERPEKVERYKSQAAGFVRGKYDWDAAVEETLRLYGG